jgi:hypothetical protein
VPRPREHTLLGLMDLSARRHHSVRLEEGETDERQDEAPDPQRKPAIIESISIQTSTTAGTAEPTSSAVRRALHRWIEIGE